MKTYLATVETIEDSIICAFISNEDIELDINVDYDLVNDTFEVYTEYDCIDDSYLSFIDDNFLTLYKAALLNSIKRNDTIERMKKYVFDLDQFEFNV